MSLYMRLYKDEVALIPDMEYVGTFTGIAYPEIRSRVDFPGQALEMHERGYYWDAGLKFPGTPLVGDVINEPWDDLTGWTKVESGSGASTISPAGELRQYASVVGDTKLHRPAWTDTGTSYTWEFEHIQNSKQEHAVMTTFMNLSGIADMFIEFGWDGTGWNVDIRVGVNSQKFYGNVTGWHTYRLLMGTSAIVEPTTGSGGWFLL